MRVVILGAKGMLGGDLASVFSDWEPKLLDKEDIDITDKDAVFDLIVDFQPELVINAAAYTDVDGAESNRELAMAVNGEAPGYLAKASKDVGAVFVHYSTDYVFHGDDSDGYKEDDEPGNPARHGKSGVAGGPLNFYGESKLAGEKAVKDVGGNYYIIRTSWLFGLNGKNFVDTILRLAQEKNARSAKPEARRELRVVNDQHGKPTLALDLARRTRELIEGDCGFGIYHITNEPATTWYDFAQEIVKQAGSPNQSQGSGTGQADPAGHGKNTRFNTSIKSSILSEVIPCSSEEFFHRSVASGAVPFRSPDLVEGRRGEGRPRPAKRPEYSILLNTKLPPSRSWQEALQEYLLARRT